MGDGSKRLLLVRPVLNERQYGYDAAFFEVLVFSLGLLIKTEAAKRKYRVVDLPGDFAVKEEFALEAGIEQDLELIIFAGHGHKAGDRVMGQNAIPVIDMTNVYLTKDKGFFCLSCHCAKKLGVAAIDAGARFFLGFSDKFYLAATETEWIVARCILSGLVAIMKGSTATQAWWSMELEFEKWIGRLEKEQSKLDPEWFLTVAILKANLSALTFIHGGVGKGNTG
jgi:hypothetical protein